MANKTEKSNIDHLRDILKELELSDSVKSEEAQEFLDAIEQELDEKDEKIEKLEDQLGDWSDDEEDEEKVEYHNTDDLGLDQLHWSLEGGNIVVEEKLQEWIKTMKVRYGMLPSHD